jgi:hypothetical protein
MVSCFAEEDYSIMVIDFLNKSKSIILKSRIEGVDKSEEEVFLSLP